MGKTWRKGRLALILMALLILLPTAAQAAEPAAGNATSTTYTLRQTQGGTNLVPTQDAYLTGDALFLDDPLRGPEDLYYLDGRLYVADTGNGRIVCLNLETGTRQVIGEGILQNPSGVFVTEAGEIYVADSALNEVVVLTEKGEVARRYGRPDSTAFGANAQYQPTKVAVSNAGIIYVVSSGSFDGVIQMDSSGEFLGYYGYNTVPMTATEILQNLIFTEAQKARLFNKIPLAFYNLALDEKGLCYTVTQRTDSAPLKKHNIAGVNILMRNGLGGDLADVCVGPDGLIFVVSESGFVYELDNDGVLLFSLGGQATNSERRGLFTLASGITVDENCCLYVLDKERGIVHTFLPTEYANLMHTAIRQYVNGDYLGSEQTLNSVLRLAGNVQMVYYYLGNVQMQLRDYVSAKANYRRAWNTSGYSNAFWEVRTQSISRWFGWGALALVALIAVFLLRSSHRGRRRSKQIYFYTDGHKAEERTFWENLKFAFRFFKSPLNSFYEVKIGARGTVGTGCALYLLGFLAFSLYYAGRGFAFSTIEFQTTSPLYLIMLFFLPVGLFVLASYMVSEINSGEGTFRRMFIGMAYGLIPMICLLPVLTLLTHVLTLSESFLVNFGLVVAVGWTGILEFLAIKEIHNYEGKQVVTNIVLTLFLMIVMIFAGTIVGMFWDTVVDTVSTLFKEVSYRVFG